MFGSTKRFYLGKQYDLKKGKILDSLVSYDPDDLSTHAVITGMTGSGKTGLGLILLEEAALAGIPAILIDPKGDLTNLLLHFPDLQPTDFEPWVDQDAARREGKTLAQKSEETAALWKNGLNDWGIDHDRLQALQDAAQYAIYTPGSDAGLPVSILASLSAPTIPWEGNKEILREKIASTVTALLGLIGLKEIDPVRAREHILLSNIFETAWSQGKDLDMAALINQVQSPPFDKLGVFPVAKFFPENDRYELAMMLNNFLAAPAFQTWLEGQPLEIDQTLYTPSGKPRHSVFYLAHLSDEERMFFTTLLYSAIETWMRTQKGANGLRALVYFDEIAGYLPPVAKPPSKPIILRLLKQARAFGVGLVLTTQNPVDLDYKALSNTGTWMVGKLQTEQDKARLLDGLEGAAPGLDRKSFDQSISRLDKRVFLLHNVHDGEPQVFHTRWAMNYLAGPLTRTQIPALNNLVNAREIVSAPRSSPDESAGPFAELGQETPPAIPGAVPIHYLPADRGPSDALKAAGLSNVGDPPPFTFYYQPALLGQARVLFLSRKHNIHHEQRITVCLSELKSQGLVAWENHRRAAKDPDVFSDAPLSDAVYPASVTPLDDAGLIRDLKKDFADWIYRTQTMTLRLNPTLDIAVGPDVTDAEMRQQCLAAAEEKRNEEVETLRAKYEKQLDALEAKLANERQGLLEDQQELEHRRMEELGTGLENVLSLFSKRRRKITTSLTKRRMTAKARADVAASEQTVVRLKKQMVQLEADFKEELEACAQRWLQRVDDIAEEQVSPFKKNIYVSLFGLVWMPYYAFRLDGDWKITAAFDWESL